MPLSALYSQDIDYIEIMQISRTVKIADKTGKNLVKKLNAYEPKTHRLAT